ncbi:MAG: tRNA (adenosine(37)-N6)-threonylcarbamoyltransferase complex ATPase subunit type 1 TsaE [Acidimicrobiia bacterium]|nr:tRNA (adenosine(37)-N6)-threonylcarbamoyltransferase complex ATPase subunit type 1 TsaE [Acidimicrobiia bacterium]
MTAYTKSADDTRALAAELGAVARPGDLLLLAGDLGAGKTTFVQGFGRALRVEEPITSPTFVIVHTYAGAFPVVHVDAYRLEHLQELLDLGLGELLDDEGVTLIEWGDVVIPALPPEFLEVRLELGEDDDARVVHLRGSGATWAARDDALRGALDRWLVEP